MVNIGIIYNCTKSKHTNFVLQWNRELRFQYLSWLFVLYHLKINIRSYKSKKFRQRKCYVFYGRNFQRNAYWNLKPVEIVQQFGKIIQLCIFHTTKTRPICYFKPLKPIKNLLSCRIKSQVSFKSSQAARHEDSHKKNALTRY